MTDGIPFTVIGGYLGAGKTTLVNHLLTKATGLRIAALINDFGAINIDAELIRSHEGDTINLANGCLCCSLVNGFAAAIGRILEQPARFDRILIEASGVADPDKIAQYGQMYQLPLDGIVVLADAEQVRAQADNKYVGDTVVRQFAQADLIVLNKSDLVSRDELIALRSWLTTLAPGKPIIESVRAQVPLEVLLGSHLPQAAAAQDRESGPRLAVRAHEDHAQVFETWMVERRDPLRREDLTRFAAGLGEHIYRAKGFVFLQDDPERRYIYQQVGTRWSLEPDTASEYDQPASRLVVIGRHGATDHASLAALLEGGTGC